MNSKQKPKRIYVFLINKGRTLSLIECINGKQSKVAHIRITKDDQLHPVDIAAVKIVFKQFAERTNNRPIEWVRAFSASTRRMHLAMLQKELGGVLA